MNKIYQTFSFSGESINCYGLEIVKRQIKRYGYEIENFTTQNNNPVLFSLYWPEQIFDYIKFRYQFGMKNKNVIIGGNTATANPDILLGLNSYVFIGDGENFDGNINNQYILNLSNKIPVEKSTAENIIPMSYEDVQTNRRAFCEMSRGCKNKCLFCQYGWLKKYRECDIVDIAHVIKKSKTKSIRLFAADRFQHNKYLDIRNAMVKSGKCDTGSDVSMRFVYKNPQYLNFTKKIRVGIEGMSERLRKLIGKPFTNDKIVEFCSMVSKAGIKCLDWYMIYGLPTEHEDDVKEFAELLKLLDNTLPEGYTIAIHWNAFTPSAQTPFQYEASSYGYNREYLNKYIFSNSRINKRIKLMHKPKFTSDETIIKRMLCIRSNRNCVNLLNTISKNIKYLKTNLIQNEFEKITGYSLLDKIDYNKEMPWDKHVIYNKEKMKKLCIANLKNFG